MNTLDSFLSKYSLLDIISIAGFVQERNTNSYVSFVKGDHVLIYCLPSNSESFVLIDYRKMQALTKKELVLRFAFHLDLKKDYTINEIQVQPFEKNYNLLEYYGLYTKLKSSNGKLLNPLGIEGFIIRDSNNKFLNTYLNDYVFHKKFMALYKEATSDELKVTDTDDQQEVNTLFQNSFQIAYSPFVKHVNSFPFFLTNDFSDFNKNKVIAQAGGCKLIFSKYGSQKLDYDLYLSILCSLLEKKLEHFTIIHNDNCIKFFCPTQKNLAALLRELTSMFSEVKHAFFINYLNDNEIDLELASELPIVEYNHPKLKDYILLPIPNNLIFLELLVERLILNYELPATLY